TLEDVYFAVEARTLAEEAERAAR
ncbi:MAG: hypothetical protein QOK06_2519, partial [Acidimicrobiaceae bacterium]